MFMVAVPDENVKAAVEDICGEHTNIIVRSQILPVLQRIHDRRGNCRLLSFRI